MLQSIRDKAQGLVAWAIVILISIPFALWGIQEYLGVTTEPAVASVNGDEIKEREFENQYRRYDANIRRQFGDAYRPELFEEKTVRSQVLDAMVKDRLLAQATDRMGMRMADTLVYSTIASNPSFQVDGRFDQATYERGLSSVGMTPDFFALQMRQMLLNDQLSGAITDSERATPRELEETVRLRNQTRELSYLQLSAADFVKPGEIADSEIEASYQSDPDRHMAPEKVKLEYLELNIDSVSGAIEPTEEDLHGYYTQHQRDYGQLERRRVSHILFTLDEGEETAKEKAEAALERLRGGETFADVAKEISEDPGSADLGGDLGFYEPGMMEVAFEQTVFALEAGGISEEPVRTEYGVHIVKLDEIDSGTVKAFELVRDKVEQAYRANEAERILYEYAERLSDLAYESPDSLTPAAEELGLALQTSDWVNRGEEFTAPGGRKAHDAAFSEDVLDEGNNSEVIELDPFHMMVLRVTEHEATSLKPLEEVRDQIAKELENQRAAAAAKEKGEALLARLEQGESLEDIASEVERALEQPGALRRDSGKLSSEIVQSLFRMPRPADEKSRYGQAILPDGDFVIIALHKVQDGSLDEMDKAERDAMAASMNRLQGRGDYDHLVQYLQDQADISTNLPGSQSLE